MPFRLKHYSHLHYFSYHLSKEIRAIYWYTFLSNLALAVVLIFEPIFLHSLGYSMIRILWFYAMIYGWYILLIGFGAMFAGAKGFKHSIFMGSVFYVMYWFTLFSIESVNIFFYIAPIFFALQKSFFWPAFDADMSKVVTKTQTGRQIGVLLLFTHLAFIIGPLLGGLISETTGFIVLFTFASVLTMASVYPLFQTPEIYTKHQYKWRTLVKIFKKERRSFFGFMGSGEFLMVLSLWPIYMNIIIPDYIKLGFWATIATLVGTVLMLYIGKIVDRFSKHKVVLWSALIFGLTWVLRFFACGIGLAVVFDSLTRTGQDVVNIPVYSVVYNNAAKKDNDHAIAYSVFFEMSWAVGMLLMALLSILILTFTGNIFAVFALAGLFTFLFGLLK